MFGVRCSVCDVMGSGPSPASPSSSRWAAKQWWFSSIMASWRASSGCWWRASTSTLCWPSPSSRSGSTSGATSSSVGVCAVPVSRTQGCDSSCSQGLPILAQSRSETSFRKLEPKGNSAGAIKSSKSSSAHVSPGHVVASVLHNLFLFVTCQIYISALNILFAGAPPVFIAAWVITKAYLNDPGWVQHVRPVQCLESSRWTCLKLVHTQMCL